MTTYRTATYNKEDLQLFAKIKEMIPIHYNMNYDDINLKSRKKEIMEIKHLVRVLLYKHTRLSLKTVGNLAGSRLDHTTILHSLQTWKGWVEVDPKIKRINAAFEKGLQSNGAETLEELIPTFNNIVMIKRGDLYTCYSGTKERTGTDLQKTLNKLKDDLHTQS